MIARLLKRWATSTLQEQLRDLEQQLEAAGRELGVTGAERDTLAAVVVRDRARVKAETAIFNRNKAEAEGLTNEQSTDESLRRFAS